LSAANRAKAGYIFAFVSNGFFGFFGLNSSSFQRWHPACKGSCQAGGKIRWRRNEQ
jgi:hypothetical protein